VPVVPRLRDTLSVRRISDGGAPLFVVSEPDGTELFRLTADGWHLLTLLDGVSDEEEVRGAYRNRVGRDMPRDELREFCAALADVGVLVASDRAVRILTYLRDQGIAYRAARPDRRAVVHPDTGSPDDPRLADRRGVDHAPFQVAVAHLNDGRLEPGLAAFRALAEARPGDVRVAEIVGHLEFLAASEDHPDLTTDRRDVAWEAFDRALAAMLTAGACPACEEPIEVALYRPNRCGACGASFTATALRRTESQRRGDR